MKSTYFYKNKTTMFSRLRHFALVLLAVASLVACQKEFVIDGIVPPPVTGPAVFTWEGAPGTCATAIVGGTYAAGLTLDSTNKVSIVVNVTTVGTYSVTTDTSNGIKFSATGAFTAVGPQTMVLYGSGTPLNAVAAIFSAGANACSFTVTSGAPIPPATFTWNGAPGVCTSATVAGDYFTGTPLDNSNTVTIAVNVTTAGTWSATTTTENGMQFSGSGNFTATGPQSITLTGTGTPVDAVPALFTPGTDACSFTVNASTGNPVSDFLRAKIDGVLKNFDDLAFAEWTNDTLSLGGMVPGSIFEVFAIDIKGTSSLVTGVYQEEGVTPGAPAYVEAGYTTDALDIWYVDINAPTPRTDPFTVTITNITPARVEGTFSGGLWNAAGGTTQLAVTEGEFSLPIQ